jgi:putative ABC transport system permease protein
MLETVLQDVRYGLRVLRHSPTFTVIAVCTLALGIGAAVGIFTVVNAILLRPLPIRDTERVAMIVTQITRTRTPAPGIGSWTKYEMLRRQTTAFSEVGAYVRRDLTIDAGDGPTRIRGARATATLFDVLGVTPVKGRNFNPEEDVEGALPVVLITDALWRDRLNADPDITGKAIRIEGQSASIIGVLPADFRLQFADREPQVYLSCVFTPDVMTSTEIRSGAGFLTYVGRLKDGVTLEQARADVASIDLLYGRENPGFVDATAIGLSVVPFVEDLVGPVRPTLRILMGAVLFLLLIACGNVAHLLLTRASARRREVAVRLALGASYGQLMRQFLTEASLLAVGGCTLGIVIARVAVTVLASRGPGNIPRLAEATPDMTVLVFAVLVSAVTAVFFGLLPAMRARSFAVGESLKTARSALSGRTGRFQRCIAASETAITVILLISSALLFRSLARLQSVHPGFESQNVTTAQITLQQSKYSQPFQREAFFSQLLSGVQGELGTATVGATSYLPLAGGNYGFFFFIDGQPHLGVGRDATISVRHVSADYFRAMQIPLRRGRTFDDSDTPQSRPVAIINEAAVRLYFKNKEPIGWHLANSRDAIMREIVGVVGDDRFVGLDRNVQPELYLPYRQVPSPTMTVVVSSILPLESVSSAIRSVARRLDPDQAVAEIRPMARIVAATTAQQQFTSSLFGTFAFVATALAAIGLYGVVTMFVNERRQEIGVRMALGAQRQDVMRLVMKHGGRVIVAGTIVGILGALALTRFLRSLLYGVTPSEPASYVIGAVVLVITGLLACYLPARRAARVDPARTLRAE